MRVLVDGVGETGTDLLQVITAHWDLLDAEIVHAHVRDVRAAHHPHLERLKDLGVVLVGDEYPAQARVQDVAHLVDYVFHAGGPGGLPRDVSVHGCFPGLRGTAARDDFPSGAPDHVLGVSTGAAGSCCVRVPGSRVHAAAAVIRVLAGEVLDEVLDAEFTVSGTPPDPDVLSRLFGGHFPLRCSTSHDGPEGLMDFRVRLASAPGRMAVRDRIDRAPHVTTTGLCDPREVTEVGRRFGLAGRLHHQAVFVEPSLVVRDGEVAGRVCVPDAGPVLSAMSAFLRRTRDPSEADRRLDQLAESLLLPSV